MKRTTKILTAASVVIAIAALFIALSEKPANAAEMVKQVIEASSAYKGWVHMRIESIEIKKPAALPAGVPVPISAAEHVNIADGTSIKVIEFEDHRRITCMSPPRGEFSEYNSKTNELRIGSLAPVTAKGLRQHLSLTPTTVEGVLAILQQCGAQALEVKLTKEKNYNCYDITTAACGEDDKGACQTCRPPQKLTIWADPRTNLIRKARIQTAEQGCLQVTVTYGPPIIEDIYDLGVPRNARIIDNRPNNDVKTVLDRLEQRAEEGFGNYVAVMTETPLKDDGTLDTDMCVVHVLAGHGDAWLWCRYLVGVREYANGKPRQAIDLIDGWPTPQINEVLRRTQSARPSDFFVTDGSRAWQHYLGELKGKYKQMLPGEKSRSSLPARIWANRYKLGLFGPDAKVELVTNNKHPAQIALRVEQLVRRSPTTKQRSVSTYWIDPSRGDVPTETIGKDYKPDGKIVEIEFHTRYLQYVQLPDGQWYPTRWQQTCNGEAQGRKYTWTREYHLHISTNMRLDKGWFTNPADRLKSDPK